jgi:glucokinase
MQVLAGDAGGTKTILAVVESAQGSFHILAEERFASRQHSGLAPIITTFLARAGLKVDVACIGVPGAITAGVCRTPNLPWVLTEPDLAAQTGIRQIELVNDFVAAAAGVQMLGSDAIATLQDGNPQPTGTRAVIGAGTGLGQAVLVWNGTSFLVNPTEAGHADLAPRGELQRELAAYLEGRHEHVSVERAVSGPGLVSIYKFLVERGVSSWPEIAESFLTEDPGEVIARHAQSHRDLACEQALDLFVEMYGAEAGNLALRVLPHGGLYVAGGIAPKILRVLRQGSFMRAFLDKGRLRDTLLTIPVYVVLDSKLGLYGAAVNAFARHPEMNR